MASAVAQKNPMSRQDWANLISADWRKSIDSVLQVGRTLADAKADLSPTEFNLMVNNDLPFKSTTALDLICVAQYPFKNFEDLPQSWSILRELAKMSPANLEKAQAKGLVTSSTTQREAKAIKAVFNKKKKPTKQAVVNPETLPTPEKANDLARMNGILVKASDGRMYSGATEQETADFAKKREQTYALVDAINEIADNPVTPQEWVTDAEDYMLHSFRLGSIDEAVRYLTELRPEVARKMGIEDAQ